MPVREIEVEAFIEDIERLAGEFGKDFEPALRQSYPIMQADIEDHFAASEGPNSTWALHSASTIARYGPHPLLILTGALAAAATGTGTGHIVEFTTHELAYGVSGIPYASVHQFGWANHPAAGIPLGERYGHGSNRGHRGGLCRGNHHGGNVGGKSRGQGKLDNHYGFCSKYRH